MLWRVQEGSSNGSDDASLRSDLARAWPLLDTVPGDARAVFEGVWHSARAAGDAEAAAVAWCGIVASMFRSRDFSLSDTIFEALQLVRQDFDRFTPLLQAQVSVAGYAIASLKPAGASQFDEWEQLAYDRARAADDGRIWLNLGVAAASAVLWLGRSMDRLVAIGSRIDSAATRLPQAAHGWIAARLHCVLAYPQARHALLPGGRLEDEPRSAQENAASDPGVASTIMFRNLTQDRLGEARVCVTEEMPSSNLLPPYDQWLLTFYKVWLEIETGDAETAALDAVRALAIAEQMAMPHAVAWSRLALARSLVSSSRKTRVCQRLAEARLGARGIRNEPLLRLCRLASALWALRNGHTARAAQLARHALRYLEGCGLFRPPLLARRDFERIFRCLHSVRDHEWAAQLRRHLGIELSQPPDSSQREVQIRCLGRFSIQRSGQLLQWPRKAPRRPLELLKALIASSPAGAPALRLVDNLWPSLDADRARKAFATALYRLRGILGEQALVLDAGWLRLDARLVWVDAHEFEAATRQAEGAQGAIALYAGAFLEDEGDLWAMEARSRMAAQFRTLVCNVGQNLLDRGEWRQALACYAEALERDSLAEVFYQGALAACRLGGLRAEASAVYERCVKEFGEKLGLGPSAQTMNMYQSVIQRSG